MKTNQDKYLAGEHHPATSSCILSEGETCFEQGLVHLQSGRFQEATAMFSKAIEVEPFHENYHFKRLESLCMQKCPAEAAATLKALTAVTLLDSLQDMLFQTAKNKTAWALELLEYTDPEKAIALYHQASLAGDIEATHHLGDIHLQGKIIPRQINQARAYYREAADKGHALSQYEAGKLLLLDKTTHPEALKYLSQAALQKNPQAYYQLSFCAQKGIAMPQNDQVAYESLLLAFENGYSPPGDTAKKHLSLVDMGKTAANGKLYRLALAYFTQALKIEPLYEPALVNLLSTNKALNSIEVWRDFLDEHLREQQVFFNEEALIFQHPEMLNELYSMINIHVRNKNIKLASLYANLVLRQINHKDFTTILMGEIASLKHLPTLLAKAKDAANKQRPSLAVYFYQYALLKDPENKEICQAFRKILSDKFFIEGKLFPELSRRAFIHGNFVAARIYCEQNLESKDQLFCTYILMMSELKLGNLELAKAQLLKAIDLKDNEEKLSMILCHCLEIIKTFPAIPNEHLSWNALAKIAFDKHHFSVARWLYHTALKNNGANAETYFFMGRCFQELELNDYARKAYLCAWKEDPALKFADFSFIEWLWAKQKGVVLKKILQNFEEKVALKSYLENKVGQSAEAKELLEWLHQHNLLQPAASPPMSEETQTALDKSEPLAQAKESETKPQLHDQPPQIALETVPSLANKKSSKSGSKDDFSLAKPAYSRYRNRANSLFFMPVSKAGIFPLPQKTYESDAQFFRQLWDKRKGDDAESLFALGEIYYFGLNSVKQDFKQAVHFYKKAAKLGFAAAEYRLGICYQLGHGLINNSLTAFIHLKSAAEKQFSLAYTLLAQLYLAKMDSTNQEKGLYWMQEAAKHNDPYALSYFASLAVSGAEVQFNLGELYYFGINGVEQNFIQAVCHYENAAYQDFPPAFYRLGICYLLGQGVSKNSFTAFTYIKQAAENNYLPAQSALNYFCMSDEATAKQDKARNWLEKAASQNDHEALEYLANLESFNVSMK